MEQKRQIRVQKLQTKVIQKRPEKRPSFYLTDSCNNSDSESNKQGVSTILLSLHAGSGK